MSEMERVTGRTGKPVTGKNRRKSDPGKDVPGFVLRNCFEEVLLVGAEDGSARVLSGSGDSLLFRPGVPYAEALRDLVSAAEEEGEDTAGLARLYPDSLREEIGKRGRLSVIVHAGDRGGEGGCRRKRIDVLPYEGDRGQLVLLVTDAEESEAEKDELREAAGRAQEANRAKSAFLANMSHEIRTPMNSVVGISEILLRKELPEDLREGITTIRDSGSSLLGIINDILDFSRIETGKLEVRETEYMLPSLLMDVSSVISVRLSNLPVRFMMDISPDVPNFLVGDDLRLKQILINLITNAEKYTREGFIELAASGRFTDDDRYELKFEVRDSGIGIREEDVEKLFASFFRVDTRQNRELSGSGLGLSISRNLARLMGGDLTVKSEYGRGSVFTISVMQKVRRYVKFGEVKDPGRYRVLICEDDEMIIRNLSRTLEGLGVPFAVCRDGRDMGAFEAMTHILIRRNVFFRLRDKVEAQFRRSHTVLILENGERADSSLLRFRQLQLPLVCIQVVSMLNGEEIVTGIRKDAFDGSRIIPLEFARVLIVDDNMTNLQVARGLMEPYRMKTDTASDGFAAVEMAGSARYDAIFMDHMMPGMDGVEAARRIRELPGGYYRDVPIIALTANAVREAKEMLLKSGLDDFVAKPIEMTELDRVLRKYVLPRAPRDYLGKIAERTAGGEGTREAEAGMPETVPGRADEEPAFRADVEEKNLQAELRAAIPGINMRGSLDRYGGSIRVYHNILKIYSEDLVRRFPELDELFSKHDIGAFTISVHAIKGASLGVGADELASMAEKLEEAGKRNDEGTIRANYPRFRQSLLKMIENVGRYVRLYVEGEDISGRSPEMYPPETVAALKDACGNMDYLEAERLLGQLAAGNYEGEAGEKIKRMLRLAETFDYDGLEEMVRAL